MLCYNCCCGFLFADAEKFTSELKAEMEMQVVGVALLLGKQGEEQDYTSKQIFSMLGKVCYSGIYVGTMGAEGAIAPTLPSGIARGGGA